MSDVNVSANEIVAFWREAGYRRWFGSDAAFDRACETRFLAAHFAAARREFEHWMDDAEGALALLVLLDQIPRNVFRKNAHAWAADPLARHYAARAIDAGFDRQVDADLRLFFYMPFEHSEDIADQERSVALHRTLPGKDADAWAVKHYEVIRRFGRFPHRNAALGRANTPEEQAYLDAGGGFG
jgi:uncharacterized protein (DUF924 family)